MGVTEDLRFAAYCEACDLRDSAGRVAPATAARFVQLYRVAPLVEFAREIGEAVTALPVIERAVAERTQVIEDELRDARRRIALLSGHLAALGVNDLGQAA